MRLALYANTIVFVPNADYLMGIMPMDNRLSKIKWRIYFDSKAKK